MAEVKLRGRCHSRAGLKIRSFHSTLHEHHVPLVQDRSAEMSADMSMGKAGHLTRRSRSCFPPLPRHSFAGVCRLADGWRVGFSGFPVIASSKCGIMKKIFFVFIAAFAGLLFSARIQAQVIEDPGNLVGYRGKNGMVLEVRVTGATDGSVWGGENGVYTDDSRLAKAAVHAGVVKPGEKVVVTVVIMAGQSSYPSSKRNGITTTGYGPWHGSYGFRMPGTQTTPPAAVPSDAIDDPGNMVAYRGRNGQTFLIRVRGTTDGSVWGGSDGMYTDDSRIGKAAVHAGVLRPGQEGVVRVTVVAGKSGYGASTKNGITTMGYGSWHGSYRFDDAAAVSSPVPPVPPAPPAIPVTPPASQPVITNAINDPGNMVAYRGRNGQVFSIRTRGTTDGSLWGGSDGVYTDDSRIGKAAVHAGLLKPGEERVLRVKILAGKPSYPASTKNGITSSGYGGWHGSYAFE